MNLAQVARLLAGFTLFFSLAFLVPLMVAWFEDQSKYQTQAGFSAGAGLGLLTAGLLFLAGRGARPDFFRKEGLAVVGFAWLVAGVLAAIPLQWSGAVVDGLDAVFESVSGLTTTGATVLGSHGNHEVEDLPASLLLWRSMLQWMGGLGIILVFVVLLPTMGILGKSLLSSEQVGVKDESLRPRMREQARHLFTLYTTLTVGCALAYWLAGMTWFDGLCHGFTTLATGGFSTKNASLGHYQNLGIELVGTLFMFLAGCNFVLMIGVVLQRQGIRRFWRSPEFRLYLLLTVLVTLAMSMALWLKGEALPDPKLHVIHDYKDFGQCLREASFQTVSILSSTGYSTADFQHWPKLALFLLVACMLIGGSAGSTAGGFKVIRVLVCLKLMANSVRLFIKPKLVERLRVGGEPVADHVLLATLSLAVLWVGFVVLGSLVLSLEDRLDVASAFSASCSMMGCTGPSITTDPQSLNLGPYGGYGDLHSWSKGFMCLQMILGRLEILAPLALLTAGFWRR